MNKSSPEGSPTIYDVAILAGVSIATVSRVLNSPERVSEFARLKVMSAIDQLGFIPKADARARALQHSGRIGIITPFFTSPSFVQRLRGVASVLTNSPYDLLIYTVDSMSRLRHYYATLPLMGHLDGLVVMSLPIDDEAAQRLVSKHLQTVFIETSHPSFSSILVDDYQGGRMAAQHLIDKGHRRCAFVHFGNSPEYSIRPDLKRLSGYREVLEENGLSIPDPYICYLPASKNELRQALRALLELPEPPSALFVPVDYLAIQIIHLAREFGMNVPKDLSVVGFDDIDMAEHVGLTTISQQLDDSGRVAAELLLAEIAESSRPVQQTHIKLNLLERETTAWAKDYQQLSFTSAR